ncbi:MAG: M20/M25/M40 family metallo-hydrolase [Ktedonobacteraceae bacterium]
MDDIHNKEYSDWYPIVRDYTRQLVGIRSVSPGTGENSVALKVFELLCSDGLAPCYTACGFDPIIGDPHERMNAFALLRGQSTRTVVLLGHIDTVGTADYGPLEPWALDPDALAERQRTLIELTEGLEEDVAAHSGDWMFGRGVVDMKSGVAANIAVMRRLAAQARTSPLPVSVVMLATPDEENESAGVLQAVRLLLLLREKFGLDYIGAINTDYTAARYPGDPHRYVYAGTVGKLLPCFLVLGREAHVGEPFHGLDTNLLAAELISDLSMNDALCDVARGQVTPPPVTLHATDLKTHYDVQLPYASTFYLNVLTLTSGPGELLERLCQRSEQVMVRTLARIDETERHWSLTSGNPAPMQERQPRSGIILTYATLYEQTVQRLGQEQVARELEAEWQNWPAELDKRDRCLHLVRRLWALSERQGPAVIIYYAPPYYPHVASVPGVFQDAVSSVVEQHADLNVVYQDYYPYLSDMSYLRLDPGVDLAALKANMPVWQDARGSTSPRPGSYSLPLEAIQQLNIPVVNMGPYGRGVHQRGEGLLMSYSFGVLPQLIWETLLRLT